MGGYGYDDNHGSMVCFLRGVNRRRRRDSADPAEVRGDKQRKGACWPY